MVIYPKRSSFRQTPSADQRQFLEMLRNIEPCDSAQTRTVRTMTKPPVKSVVGSSGDRLMVFQAYQLGI